MADNFHDHTSPEMKPSFDTAMSSNVTGLAGEIVQLTCRVNNLGNKTVSVFNRLFFSSLRYQFFLICVNDHLAGNDWIEFCSYV